MEMYATYFENFGALYHEDTDVFNLPGVLTIIYADTEEEN
jgi:hypothetical protein